MGANHLSMSRLNLKVKIFTQILASDYWRSIIPGTCPSSKFVTFCQHVVSHSMYRPHLKFFLVYICKCNRVYQIFILNLKFKIFTEILVSNCGGVNHLSMSRLNLKFNIFTEILVGYFGGVNHLSMSRLNFKFKIFTKILVSKHGGSPIFPHPG